VSKDIKLTIHQPEHLPWLGLIDKISQADIFVVLDTVQYRKNYFQNRNKIRTSNGWQWLTVPIQDQSLKTPINRIKISYDRDWQKKYLKSLKLNYGRAKYFTQYYPKIEIIINSSPKYLADLNHRLLEQILDWFKIRVRIIKSSDLKLGNIKDGGSAVVLRHCQKLNCKYFLSGEYGKDYLHISDFEKAKIHVIFHHFKHPIYQQLYKPFLTGMSAVDLLFNNGPDSKKILWGNR